METFLKENVCVIIQIEINFPFFLAGEKNNFSTIPMIFKNSILKEKECLGFKKSLDSQKC